MALAKKGFIMPTLRTLGEALYVKPVSSFTFNEERMGECKLITDDDFGTRFLNKKELPSPETFLQLYYLDRKTLIDEVKFILQTKFLTSTAQLHRLLSKYIPDQECWLPMRSDEISINLFMADKKNITTPVEVFHWSGENMWNATFPKTDSFIAGAVIIAQAGAL